MATHGASAPASNTINLDALMSTTVAAYKKQMFDNIFKDNAFLAYLKKSGAIKTQNGGQRMVMPLMYETNGTIRVHSGYETIDTTPQDGITSAEYDWGEIAGTISISRKEERQNAGEGRIINLLDSKIKQAEMTMTEYLTTSLLVGEVSSATFVPLQSRGGVDGLNPLGYFLRKDPSTDPVRGGNVGNIAGATYSWWRPQFADGNGSKPSGGSFGISASTFAIFKQAFYRMYNYCSRGTGGSPDLIVADQISFETYENALDQSKRYVDTDMADMGFQTVKCKTATMLWDEQTPDIESGTTAVSAGTAFFINSKFYHLWFDSETGNASDGFIVTPFVEPENQTAKTAKVLAMGQAGVSNMRKHGVLWGLSQAVTS
jgi:hypothetical protein